MANPRPDPLRRTLLLCAAALSAAMLAAAQALAAGRVPTVEARQADEDRVLRGDPAGETFFAAMKHYLDSVAGQSETPVQADNRVKGIDRFAQHLARELACGNPSAAGNGRVASCNDQPRNEIFENAMDARRGAKLAYDALREGSKDLDKARDILKEAAKELKRLTDQNREFNELLRQTVGLMNSDVTDWQTSPPEAKEGGERAQQLQGIRDLEGEYRRVEADAKQAQDPLSRAEERIGVAEAISGNLEMLAVKAGELHRKADRSLLEDKRIPHARQTERGRGDMDSEQAIRNSREALQKALEKARKAKKKLDDFAQRELPEAVEKAVEENKLTVEARGKSTESDKKIGERREKIEPLRPPWDAAPPEARPPIEQKAQEHKDKGQEAQREADESVKKAEAAGKACAKCAGKAGQTFALGDKQLGERTELPELPDLNLQVPPPNPGQSVTRSRDGGRGSRRPKYPDILREDDPVRNIRYDGDRPPVGR